MVECLRLHSKHSNMGAYHKENLHSSGFQDIFDKFWTKVRGRLCDQESFHVSTHGLVLTFRWRNMVYA